MAVVKFIFYILQTVLTWVWMERRGSGTFSGTFLCFFHDNVILVYQWDCPLLLLKARRHLGMLLRCILDDVLNWIYESCLVAPGSPGQVVEWH